MIDFYLYGHDYEFEVKNIYRIFDLNSTIRVNFDIDIDFNSADIVIASKLINEDDRYISEATVFKSSNEVYNSSIDINNIKVEKNDSKKLKKTVVKKALYEALSGLFNEKSEYGFLTGIRPNKILTIALQNNLSREEANTILAETYEVAPEKIKLLNDIYDKQKRYINQDINLKNYNLYIHVPFCPTKCTYCSFVSTPKYNDSILDEYVKTLCYEIDETIRIALKNNLKLNTIYFGGGTPSVLSCDNINNIFSVIKRYYDLSGINEITFEAGRPDTITENKLLCLKNNLVGRLSINPQTMNQSTLKRVCRNHTVEDIIDVYRLARDIGFDSVNMDMIIGLPGESEEDVKNSISEIVKLKPDNITIHALSYKKGSKLLNDSKFLSKDTEQMEAMYSTTKNICTNNGYLPYYMYRQKNIKGNLENIGYAVDGKESIYNIVIIEEIETILACGAGAVSKILKGNNRHERVQNYKELKDYNQNVNKNIVEKINILGI